MSNRGSHELNSTASAETSHNQDDLQRSESQKHHEFLDEQRVLEATENNVSVFDLCPKRDRLWIFYPHLLKLNILLLAPILSQVISGYDASLMNGMQTLASWERYFGTPKGSRLGTLSNGVTIGTLIACPFVPYIIGPIGRKYTIIMGSSWCILGAILQATAHGFAQFVIARVLLGIGLAHCAIAAGPMLSECSYPTQRTSVTAMLQGSWSFGSFVSALITWGCYHGKILDSSWSWRTPSLLQFFFPMCQIILALLGPESPRWLVSKGREEEARKFFVKYHANGDEHSMLVSYQMAQVVATLEEEKLQKIASWKHYLQKNMLRRTFITVFLPGPFIQLMGNALISYYLNIILESMNITNSITKLKINLGITVYSYCSSMVVATVADRFHRRTLFLFGAITTWLCYIIWTILSAIGRKENYARKSISIGIIALIYLYQGFYHCCGNIATPYIMELTPFFLRAKSATIYQLSGNAIGFFNNYVNPVAMAAIDWKYYIVYCCWLTVIILIVFFVFPETHGKGLEEVTEMFEKNVGREAILDKTRAELDLEKPNKVHVEEV